MSQVFCGYVFPLLLGVDLGVEMLAHVVAVLSILKNCPRVFKVIPSAWSKGSNSLTSQPTLATVIYVTAMLVGVWEKQHLKVSLFWTRRWPMLHHGHQPASCGIPWPPRGLASPRRLVALRPLRCPILNASLVSFLVARCSPSSSSRSPRAR